MSLLGFDAVGSLAVAQLARAAATNTIFAATPAALTLSGRSAGFQSAIAAAAAGLVCNVVPAGARVALLGSQTSWLTSGRPVTYSLGALASPGNVALSGVAAVSTSRMVSASQSCSVTGPASAFFPSITAQSGAYQTSGYGVEFGRGFEAWFPLAINTGAWNGSEGPAGSWLPAPVTEERWVDVDASNVSWSSPARSSVNWKSI
jgi:hypothetical protein